MSHQGDPSWTDNDVYTGKPRETSPARIRPLEGDPYGAAHTFPHTQGGSIPPGTVVSADAATCARRDSNPRPSAPEAEPSPGAPVHDPVPPPGTVGETRCGDRVSGAASEGAAHTFSHTLSPARRLVAAGRVGPRRQFAIAFDMAFFGPRLV